MHSLKKHLIGSAFAIISLCSSVPYLQRANPSTPERPRTMLTQKELIEDLRHKSFEEIDKILFDQMDAKGKILSVLGSLRTNGNYLGITKHGMDKKGLFNLYTFKSWQGTPHLIKAQDLQVFLPIMEQITGTTIKNPNIIFKSEPCEDDNLGCRTNKDVQLKSELRYAIPTLLSTFAHEFNHETSINRRNYNFDYFGRALSQVESNMAAVLFGKKIAYDYGEPFLGQKIMEAGADFLFYSPQGDKLFDFDVVTNSFRLMMAKTQAQGDDGQEKMIDIIFTLLLHKFSYDLDAAYNYVRNNSDMTIYGLLVENYNDVASMHSLLIDTQRTFLKNLEDSIHCDAISPPMIYCQEDLNKFSGLSKEQIGKKMNNEIDRIVRGIEWILTSYRSEEEGQKHSFVGGIYARGDQIDLDLQIHPKLTEEIKRRIDEADPRVSVAGCHINPITETINYTISFKIKIPKKELTKPRKFYKKTRYFLDNGDEIRLGGAIASLDKYLNNLWGIARIYGAAHNKAKWSD
ncbi:MAG: hypothetical protein AABX38_03195 [Candidatus Micrarchaeota archaeon]